MAPHLGPDLASRRRRWLELLVQSHLSGPGGLPRQKHATATTSCGAPSSEPQLHHEDREAPTSARAGVLDFARHTAGPVRTPIPVFLVWIPLLITIGRRFDYAVRSIPVNLAHWLMCPIASKSSLRLAMRKLGRAVAGQQGHRALGARPSWAATRSDEWHRQHGLKFRPIT